MGIYAMRFALIILIATLSLGSAAAQERMSPELLWKLARIGGGQLAPDGTSLLYSVRRYDLTKNGGDSNLFVVNLKDGKTTQLTDAPTSESAATWVQTRLGLRVFFLSRRDGDKSTQCWALNPKDGKISRVTKIDGGIANLKVAPTGDRIAFTRDVKMDQTVNELHKDLPLANARIIDSLLYRHWDSWHDYRYSHLCTAPLGEDLTAGKALDLMKGLKVDCPVPPFGGSEQFNFSPDGKEIAFTMKIAKNWVESTDSDIYLVPSDGSDRMRCATSGMNGYDNDPVYSPDGRYLTFQSMKRPGFESDKNRILRIDRESGDMIDLTDNKDQTTHEVVYSADNSALYYKSEWRGCDHLFRMDTATGKGEQVTRGPYNWSLRDITPDGTTLIVARQNMIRPWELGTIPAEGGEFKPLTDVNGAVYKRLDLPKIGERWVRATDGKMIHNWVIYPPGFDKEKKYPMITYFQGGPQGQIGQWFSYRWNFHLMAAHGYVVLAPNRRGLPGFGREWNDEISGDWGGQAMRDILSSHDDMLTEPFIDADRCGGVGASFGGYTAYWMMGRAEQRFKALIAHCGVFNLESMYGATEELFFVNWDLGGPYWSNPEVRQRNEKFSPNRFVGNWKTPLLVIHGQKDFRVPVTQGMEAFTAAQVEGVPSRFLYFPEEGHWVLSPQNGVLWHRVFFDWLERYLKPKK